MKKNKMRKIFYINIYIYAGEPAKEIEICKLNSVKTKAAHPSRGPHSKIQWGMRVDVLGEDGWIILWGAQEIDRGRIVKDYVWARAIIILFKLVSIIFRREPNVRWTIALT